MKHLDNYEQGLPLNEKEFVFEFIKPETLSDPMPIFYKALMDLRDKIGADKLTKNLKTFCKGWALNSGYCVVIDSDKKHVKFTHISID